MQVVKHAQKALAVPLPPKAAVSRPKSLRAPIAPFTRPSNPTPFTRFIYAYYNIRTKQTLYSLSRTLSNSLAMQQITFVGKQTHQAALRKDVWLPLMTVVFPESETAMYRTHACYQQFCEYKKLHELASPAELVHDEYGHRLPKKQLGYVLMRQKYNAVADLAAVLSRWPSGVRSKLEELTAKQGRYEALKARRPQSIHKPRLKVAEHDAQRIKLLTQVSEELDGAGDVEVHWADILDAEYAEQWPAGVVHAQMQQDTRNRHASPVPVPKRQLPEVDGSMQIEGSLGQLDGGPRLIEEGRAI